MGEISQSVEVGHYGRWVCIRAVFDSGAEMSFLNEEIAKILIGQDWMQKNDVVLDMRGEKLRYGTGQPRLKKIYRLR